MIDHWAAPLEQIVAQDIIEHPLTEYFKLAETLFERGGVTTAPYARG